MTSAVSIKRFRILLLAAAVFYPAWAGVNRLIVANGVESLAGRLLVSALCVAFIASSFVPLTRRYLEWLCFAACCVIVTHNAYLVNVNDLNLIYILGYTLVVFGLSISFESQPLLLGFIIYTIAVTMFSGQGETSLRHLYSGAAILALLMSYLAFRDKLAVLASLRRKNDELETTQMFLKNTAQVANIGGWSLDVDKQVLWWSDQTYVIHDVALGTAIDVASAIDFYAPEARATIADAVDRAIHQQLTYDLTLPFLTAKGRRIWVRAIGKPAIHLGRTTGLYGSFQDITDQVHLKEEDQRLSHLLTNVLDNLPHGVFAKDLKNGSKYVIWNKGMENLFKIQARDVLGKDDSFLFDAKVMKRIERLDQIVLDGKSLLDLAEEEINSKLVRFPAHSMRVPVLDTHGEPQLILGILEDISEMKKREAQIRDQQTQLLHASRMSTLGEMSGGVAHEINNPLTIIMGFTRKIEMALASEPLDVNDIKRSTEKITGMTERIAKIVRGLKTFAREASHDPFTPVSVRAVVDDSLDLCKERLVNAGIELMVDEIPHDITADCRSIQISQVLVNLLNNAHDAIQDKPLKWIKISAREYSGSVEISVTDSGAGIPPEIAEKILQPFFTTKGVGVGTGLGLSISKGIMESHKGRLYYDPGSTHTRFVVTFPKQQIAPRVA